MSAFKYKLAKPHSQPFENRASYRKTSYQMPDVYYHHKKYEILSPASCVNKHEFYYLYDIEVFLNRTIWTRRIDDMLCAGKHNISKHKKIIQQALHTEILPRQMMNWDWSQADELFISIETNVITFCLRIGK